MQIQGFQALQHMPSLPYHDASPSSGCKKTTERKQNISLDQLHQALFRSSYWKGGGVFLVRRVYPIGVLHSDFSVYTSHKDSHK